MLFFVFKQKTAYEMRISDWSSDVCSSDLKNQYRIRLDAPVDEGTLSSAVLFIAERVETLMGIWGIGLVPTGERDPYGLRRAALGLISAFEQLNAGGYLKINDSDTLRLPDLLTFTAGTFKPGVLDDSTAAQVQAFIYERYRNQLNNDFDRNVVDAVLTLEPALHQVQARIQDRAEERSVGKEGVSTCRCRWAPKQ